MSTTLVAGAYDEVERTLDLTFATGRRYRYAAVPPATFDALCSAPSKGGFFNAHIRDRYAHQRLR